MQKVIFLVEDNEMIATLLRDFLVGECGYHVLIVKDARFLLEIVQFMIPDLFILDYWLPSMNGLELGALLQKEILYDIPILFISTMLLQEEMTQHGLIGLEKPFEFEALFRLINRLLGREPSFS